MAGGVKIISGGLGTCPGGFAAGGGFATAIKVVRDRSGGIQIVDLAGVVEIQTEIEGPLIQDGAKGHHGVVGVRVAPAHGKLGIPGALGLLHERLGALDAGAGNLGIRTVCQRVGHRAVEGPGLRGAGPGGDGDKGRAGEQEAKGCEGHGNQGVREPKATRRPIAAP